VAGSALKEPMREILRSIENGEFAKEWNQEVKRNYSTLRMLTEQARSHPMIIAEKDLRERIKTNDSSS
jgi:ketol-acid reductoisomerase